MPDFVCFFRQFFLFVSSFLSKYNLLEETLPDYGCLATREENSHFRAISKTRPTRFSLIEKFLGQVELEVSISDPKSHRNSFPTQTQNVINASFLSTVNRRPSLEESVSVMKLFVNNGAISLNSVPDLQNFADILVAICCKQPTIYFQHRENLIRKEKNLNLYDANIWFTPELVKSNIPLTITQTRYMIGIFSALKYALVEIVYQTKMGKLNA